ncbi:hypothetical protein EV384_5208 [Micromonospora kangleipakensis]|uniref:Uncharacterized protein n=1 Tax=Micromonospora kangleipakensis TaxID=1077942 RepID=A0A4V6MGV1_9ACTN|nr:hypothetical protein EV384_5208 [Micromonospora kangleipakensis]
MATLADVVRRAGVRRLRPDTALRDGRGSASIGSMIERKGVRALAR